MSYLILILCIFLIGLSCFMRVNRYVAAGVLIGAILGMFLDFIYIVCF